MITDLPAGFEKGIRFVISQASFVVFIYKKNNDNLSSRVLHCPLCQF